MKQMLLFLFVALLVASGIAKAQDTLAKRSVDSAAKKNLRDTARQKPIGDSVNYISNRDIDGIFRYISDRTSGTQYFQIFRVLNDAITDTKRKAEERYRQKSKKN